jgi:hypothetical protein
MTAPKLLIAYVGPSGAVERVVTPTTAARNWPELAGDVATEMVREWNRMKGARDKAEEKVE